MAVPTPVDEAHNPDFRPLIGASLSVGRNLKRGAIVVFESTVYPGATEEVCVPVLEKHSGLQVEAGLSSSAIRPSASTRATSEHTLTTHRQGGVRATRRRRWSRWPRCTAASSRPACTRRQSIKVAEAAKVIENTQRDLNIALVNELSMIFHRIGIDTLDVLEGGRHEVELPAVPARPGRRPLHRRRSLLPDPQGRAARLSPAGDPRRAPHQRRHGQVRRRADRQAA